MSAEALVIWGLDRLEDLLPQWLRCVLTSWCWLLAGSFNPLLYGLLHKAVWEFSWHGNLASSRGSCLRECKTEATMSSNWALEVTHCHFLSTLLVIRSALLSVRDDCTRVCIPGGQDHWSHLGGWLSQEQRLWNPSPTMISSSPFLICEMGIPTLGGYRSIWDRYKNFAQCLALDKHSINLLI